VRNKFAEIFIRKCLNKFKELKYYEGIKYSMSSELKVEEDKNEEFVKLQAEMTKTLEKNIMKLYELLDSKEFEDIRNDMKKYLKDFHSFDVEAVNVQVEPSQNKTKKKEKNVSENKENEVVEKDAAMLGKKRQRNSNNIESSPIIEVSDEEEVVQKPVMKAKKEKNILTPTKQTAKVKENKSNIIEEPKLEKLKGSKKLKIESPKMEKVKSSKSSNIESPKLETRRGSRTKIQEEPKLEKVKTNKVEELKRDISKENKPNKSEVKNKVKADIKPSKAEIAEPATRGRPKTRGSKESEIEDIELSFEVNKSPKKQAKDVSQKKSATNKENKKEIEKELSFERNKSPKKRGKETSPKKTSPQKSKEPIPQLSTRSTPKNKELVPHLNTRNTPKSKEPVPQLNTRNSPKTKEEPILKSSTRNTPKSKEPQLNTKNSPAKKEEVSKLSTRNTPKSKEPELKLNTRNTPKSKEPEPKLTTRSSPKQKETSPQISTRNSPNIKEVTPQKKKMASPSEKEGEITPEFNKASPIKRGSASPVKQKVTPQSKSKSKDTKNKPNKPEEIIDEVENILTPKKTKQNANFKQDSSNYKNERSSRSPKGRISSFDLTDNSLILARGGENNITPMKRKTVQKSPQKNSKNSKERLLGRKRIRIHEDNNKIQGIKYLI
jgi:hypothetical protein